LKKMTVTWSLKVNREPEVHFPSLCHWQNKTGRRLTLPAYEQT